MQKPSLDLAEQRLVAKVLDGFRGDVNYVLDYGCGIGRFLPLLEERFYSVYATDFSLEMLKRAKEINGQNIKFCEPDKLPEVDMIFCFTVLLHIVSDRLWRETLQRLWSATKDYLVICEKFKTKRCLLGRHNKLRTLQSYLKEVGQYEWYKFYPDQGNGLNVLIIKK